jgi:Ca2+-binding EF-hand superfamily protein
MKTSARPLQEIFSEFDVDGNGVVTAVEFRNAIRKLNLGLSSKEID